MSILALTLLSILALFLALLLFKQLRTSLRFCAICLAVSLTWLGLLVLSLLKIVDNQLIIGILMGQSSLGVYYLLEKRAPKKLLIFRLPVLMTLILTVYSAITIKLPLDALLIVLSIWLIVGLLYFYRSKPGLRNKVKAIIECCSDW